VSVLLERIRAKREKLEAVSPPRGAKTGRRQSEAAIRKRETRGARDDASITSSLIFKLSLLICSSVSASVACGPLSQEIPTNSPAGGYSDNSVGELQGSEDCDLVPDHLYLG